MILALLAAAGGAWADGSAPGGPSAPRVLSSSELSALPAARSVGAGGPINRVALDVANFGPQVPGSVLECIYPGAVRYRCRYQFADARLIAGLSRVEVLVPDLELGSPVRIRLSSSAGATEIALALSNPSQIVHQIEGVALPEGGRTVTGSDGRPAPLLTLQSFTAVIVPALALRLDDSGDPCEQLQATWERVSATDAVFLSRFGPLSGTVVLQEPVARRAAVSVSSAPRWLVTYTAASTRVQFIAHYEVTYRVRPCPARLIGP